MTKSWFPGPCPARRAVHTPSLQLACVLCLEAVAEQPAPLKNCDHVICRACLLTALGTSRRCPNAAPRRAGGAPRRQRPWWRTAAEFIDELEVHCLHGVEQAGDAWTVKAGGCAAAVTRGALAHHLREECEWAEVRCGEARAGCVWRGARRGLAAHGAACWHARARPFMERLQRELAEAKAALRRARRS